MKNKKKILMGAVGIAAVSLLMVGCSNKKSQNTEQNNNDETVTFLGDGHSDRQWYGVSLIDGEISKGSDVWGVYNVNGQEITSIYETDMELKEFRSLDSSQITKKSTKNLYRTMNASLDDTMSDLSKEITDGQNEGAVPSDKVLASQAKELLTGLESITVNGKLIYKPVKSKVKISLETDNSGNHVDSETINYMEYDNSFKMTSNYYESTNPDYGSEDGESLFVDPKETLDHAMGTFSKETGMKSIKTPNRNFWRWVGRNIPVKSKMTFKGTIYGQVYSNYYVGYRIGDSTALITRVKDPSIAIGYDSLDNKLVKVD